MTELEARLNLALSEKAEKIIPENIKKGVTIFGIDGELDSESVMTEEDYEICETLADEILSGAVKDIQLEYIEADGQQYIITDTMYSSNNVYKIETEICYMEYPTDESKSLMGWDAGGAFGINNTGKLFNGTETGNTGVISKEFNILTLTIDNGTSTLLCNGYSVSRTNKNISSYATDGYPVFALVTNTGINATQIPIRIKSYKIYVNGSLVCDLIPIKNTSNIICMYDNINDKYYYNKGTGTFVGGGEI